MKLHSLLAERYLNLWEPDQKRKYADVVWDMLTKSYVKAGGFKSARDVEDLINDSSLWKLSRKDGRIIAVSVYKDKFGRKAIASGTDGTSEGKQEFVRMMVSDIIQNRAWAEVSGAAEHLKIKHGATPVPNRYAAMLTGKDILSYNPDGYHYTRLIAGEPHEKMIVGFYLDRSNSN